MYPCNMVFLIWLVYTSSLFLKSVANSSSDISRPYFLRESDKLKFNHMVVDRYRDWVFISAVNRLYQLDSNLKVVSNWTTGPKENFKTWQGNEANDNYNKILVLDYVHSQLLLCGSVSHGSCHIYRFEGNPSKVLKPAGDSIVVDGETESVVAFIAPNSKKKCLSLWRWTFCTEYGPLPALYVGIEYTQHGHESKPPTITRADLKENTLFNVNKKLLTKAYKKKNVLAYVHGFSSGYYNYFLSTEINANQPSQHISKLIRICLEDDKYNSYTEIPIECHDGEGIQYNLAQAAFVGTPGLHLAESLNIKLEDDVLFGIFSQSEAQSLNNTTKKASNKSALCIYPLNKVNDMFTQNIQNCFNGMGNRGLEFMIPPKNQTCKKDELHDVCAQHVNMPLEGKSPVKAQATTTFNMSVKAITASSHTNGFTVLFLGTNDGDLIHLGVKNSSTMCEYNRITLDEGFAINSDLHFDNKTETLYTLTERQLTKVKIPFPAPSITTFEPTTGLAGISINVTIEGDNLGCAFKKIENITVAGIPCTLYKHLYKSLRQIFCIINIASKMQKPFVGPVEIQFTDLLVRSSQNFKIFDPNIKHIYPKNGSVHGNTKLTISGEHFDTEDHINVFIGNTSCQVFFCTSSEIKCVTKQSHPKNVEVILMFGNYSRPTNHFYEYTNDTNRDENGFNLVPKGIPSGGIIISIHNNIDQNFSTIQEMIFQVKHNGHTYNGSKCIYKNTLLMRCFSPQIANVDSNLINAENPKEMNYTLLIKHNGTNATFHVNSSTFFLYPNPIFYNFSVTEYDGNVNFEIRGKNIDNACQRKDFNVRVGNDSNCTIISLSQSEVICRLYKSNTTNNLETFSEKQPTTSTMYENIVIQIGTNKTYTVSKVKNADISNPFQTIYGISYFSILVFGLSIFSFITLVLLCAYFIYCRNGKFTKKQLQERMNKLELCVAAECREAFAELQTKMLNSISENCTNNLPFLDYRTFVMKNAFPNLDDHSFILSADATLHYIYNNEPSQLLNQLIHNKTFLLIFIRTVESLGSFSMNDRVHVASMLMIALQSKMEYCTDILETLLSDLIKKYTRGKTHPKLLLRRSESIVEKMLSIWFTFLLHKFLTETSGEPLFRLFKAIKKQINRGPVDMITYEARYSLNEAKLIRQCINYRRMTVYVDVSQKDASVIGLESPVEMKPVNVLDCDTISQVKEKILDTLCPNMGFSKRPKASTFNLKLSTSAPSKYSNLQDDDSSSKTEKGWKQKNTLLHYGVQDGGKISLVPTGKTMNSQTSFDSFSRKSINKFKSHSSSFDSTSSLMRKNIDVDCNIKEWHLVKPNISDSEFEDQNGSDKMVSEIYLTRLLATKSTLQQFVDDLFKTILNQEPKKDYFPMAIKHMFDFLDYQAFLNGITDPEVVHTWKSNCLPLRFWVNLIKNPNFLFDVHKSEIIDSCLSVVAQAFMDSFSTTELNLDKDSPTSKLLYAKDIVFYKEWVKKYYEGIQSMPAVSKQDMNELLAKESLLHANDFNTNEAMHRLYRYMVKYKEELMIALKKDQSSLTYSLAQTFEEVNCAISRKGNLDLPTYTYSYDSKQAI